MNQISGLNSFIIYPSIVSEALPIPATPQKAKHRKIVEVETNRTPAWRESLGSDDLAAATLQDKIRTLAEKRLQCHYIDSCAYFRSGCEIALSKTTWQGGSSNKKGWQANHYALLPELKDNSITKIFKQITLHGLTPALKNYLQVRGASFAQIQELQNKYGDASFVQDFFNTNWPGNMQKSLLAGTRYELGKNATITLPSLVNAYDGKLEHAFRSKALGLVQQCAKGEIDPLQSVIKLQSAMQSFFDNGVVAVKHYISHIEQFENLYLQALQLKQKGIVSTADQQMYKQLVVELQQVKKNALQKSPFFPSNKITKNLLHNCIKQLKGQNPSATSFQAVSERADNLLQIIEQQKAGSQFHGQSLRFLVAGMYDATQQNWDFQTLSSTAEGAAIYGLRTPTKKVAGRSLKRSFDDIS